MALNDTIREVWALALQQNLQKALRFGQPGVINRNYEGEIRQWGDRVHIQSIGAVAVVPYTKNTDLGTPEILDDDKQTLTIDQQDATNVFLDDIDRVQANPGVAAELSRESSYALGDAADQFIAALMVAGADTDNAVTADVSTAAGAYDALLEAGVKLDEANIASEGRFAVLPSWFEALLLSDEKFVSFGTDANRSALTNAVIGSAAGFTLVKSNNVPNESDDYTIPTGVSSATTFASQVSKVESIRHPARFGDIVRALHVYGGKVIRPEGLAIITATRSAS
jgi:hypothetical protein